MKTISQRELRNDSAAVMRRVGQGEGYTVTRRGVPVGRLVPPDPDPDLRCDRPAKKRVDYTTVPRIRIETPTGELLADLRDGR